MYIYYRPDAHPTIADAYRDGFRSISALDVKDPIHCSAAGGVCGEAIYGISRNCNDASLAQRRDCFIYAVRICIAQGRGVAIKQDQSANQAGVERESIKGEEKTMAEQRAVRQLTELYSTRPFCFHDHPLTTLDRDQVLIHTLHRNDVRAAGRTSVASASVLGNRRAAASEDPTPPPPPPSPPTRSDPAHVHRLVERGVEVGMGMIADLRIERSDQIRPDQTRPPPSSSPSRRSKRNSVF